MREFSEPMREFASEKDKNKIILKKIIFHLFVKWNKKKHMHTTNRRPNYSSIMETSNKIQTGANKKGNSLKKARARDQKRLPPLRLHSRKKSDGEAGQNFCAFQEKPELFEWKISETRVSTLRWISN